MLILLKLGGSLITDKNTPQTVDGVRLARLCAEIHRAYQDNPAAQLILGHGSGSFGHMPARKYRTRDGVHSRDEWLGFVEVWQQARALNSAVLTALHAAGLPAVAFPVSAAGRRTLNGKIEWDLSTIKAALNQRLLPVVYGDVLFDDRLGGTIISTEEIFEHLAGTLSVDRILIAGKEAGVYSDFPANKQVIPKISPANIIEVSASLRGSESVDVTGGMAAKVHSMLSLTANQPGLTVRIFSGLEAESVYRAICGEPIGTLISQEQGG